MNFWNGMAVEKHITGKQVNAIDTLLKSNMMAQIKDADKNNEYLSD